MLTGHGIELLDVCLGEDGVLVGSARQAREARERVEAAVREQDADRRRRELELTRQAMEARVASLRAEFSMEQEQLERLLDDAAAGRERAVQDRAEIARSRQAGRAAAQPQPRSKR